MLFSDADLDRTISLAAREAICELILAWADLDTIVSYWTIKAFGMQLDVGSIMLGTMDTKTRLMRLKQLYEHKRNMPFAKNIGKLSKEMATWVDCRNIVCHQKCIGQLTSDNERIVFSQSDALLERKDCLRLTLFT